MNVPRSFIVTVTTLWGIEGERWLKSLDDRIDRLKKYWDITTVQVVDRLTYNLVAYVDSSIYGPAVLKLSVKPEELQHEWAALEYFGGTGAVKVIAYEKQEGALLLERCQPGTPLTHLFPDRDEQATDIALEIIEKLASKSANAKSEHGNDAMLFLTMNQWFSPLLNQNQKEIPSEYLLQARFFLEEILEMNLPVRLAHGDLHHGNILQSEQGWVSIDPKGVYGTLGFDVGCLLRNPLDELVTHSNMSSLIGRRLDQCAYRLSIDRSFLVKLGYVQAVLAASWALSDRQPQWKDFLICARHIV